MTPDEKAKQMQEDLDKADKARKDAEEAEKVHNGETLDKILSCLDSLGKRMDSYDEERKADAARRKDAQGDQNSASGEPEPAGGAGARLPRDKDEDREEGKPRELAADSRKDSRMDSAADAEEIENYKRENGATHKIAADSVLAQIQSDADRAASAWGKSAVQPWDGESIVAYRRRTAREHQQHSPAWKDVNLREVSGQALRNATQQIYADSIAASASPESYPDTLIERHLRDPISGQKRIEFYGSPSAWTNQFKSGATYVKATSGWKQD
jgi:hypothetical protein